MTPSFARLLQKLLDGEHITYATFQGTSRKLLDRFINDGVLEYTLIGTQQKKILCHNVQNLHAYLHHKYQIPSLTNYIDFDEKENTTGSDAVRATSDSKYRKIRVLEGFLVNVYDEIRTTLDGREFNITPARGTFTFVHNFMNFLLPEDVTVVGVEGHENFREIASQRYLFHGVRPLFVWRYQNSLSIARWLNLIPNSYLHYGDFDPKGLHIYISEFRNKIGASRCGFVIPPDLDTLTSTYGDKELYEEQMEYLKEFDFDSVPEISEVISVIRKYKKGLEQQVLIG